MRESIMPNAAKELAMSYLRRRELGCCAALAVILVSVPAAALTGGKVHAGFVGEWVPAAAACSSPIKLVIAQDRVVFVNGSDRIEYTKLEQCFSCAGQGVEGVTMLSTEAMGDSPFMITLDESRKKAPALTVDFSNDKKLGRRFAFGARALKRCS